MRRIHLARVLFVGWLLSVPAACLNAQAPEKPNFDPAPVVGLLEFLLASDNAQGEAARQSLAVLGEKVQTGELAGAPLEALRPRLLETLANVLAGDETHPLYADAAMLAATLGDEQASEFARRAVQSNEFDDDVRLAALAALIFAGDPRAASMSESLLIHGDGDSAAFRAGVLAFLGRSENPRIGRILVRVYPGLEESLKPKAIALLTERSAWSRSLLEAMQRDEISPNVLNVNQVRTLMARGDPELSALLTAEWGVLREDRDPRREQVIAEVRGLLAQRPGDPFRGRQVFARVCGQCHQFHGEGQQVGPDITSNGRASLEQLLSNVLDPSLVIGSAYQASTLVTIDGRIITGLLAEDGEQRVVLKVQGGKTEIIPRADIDEMEVSRLSLMPEDLEKQLTGDELIDLFAYISLDLPPENPAARLIPGAADVLPTPKKE